MRATFIAELFKIRKRSAMWLCAGLWMLLSVIFGYVFPYFSYRDASGPKADGLIARSLPGGIVGTAVAAFPMFAGALALIIGVLAMGSEYSWGTVKTILSQRPRRGQVIAGKTAALIVVMGLIVVATFAVDAAAAAIVSALTSHSSSWPSIGHLLRGFAGGWMIVSMWCLGGMFLGILVRGTTLAVGLGLVWALAIENLLRAVGSVWSPMETFSKYLPASNAGGLVAALGSTPADKSNGVPGVTDIVGGTHGAIVVGCYVVALIVAAGYILRRRDVA